MPWNLDATFLKREKNDKNLLQDEKKKIRKSKNTFKLSYLIAF